MLPITHLVFVSLLLHFAPHAWAKSVSCSTSACHGEIKKYKFLHGPNKANGCVVCHQLAKDQPAKSQHPELLPIPKDNSTCLICHDDKTPGALPFEHKAVEKSGCLECHDPHGSNFKNLRKKEPVSGLCLSCHDELKDKPHGPHSAVFNSEQSCTTCHNPHMSKEPKLLKSPEGTLCLQCHDNSIHVTKAKFKHKPVADGMCHRCHIPHGSDERFFLRKTTPELCVECHSESKTSFRNGDSNLHDFHLNNGKRKVSCTACHEVHSSPQARLIRPNMDFSGWSVPIRFTKTQNGGTCLAACHGKKSYDRNNPVKNKPGR